MIWLNGGPSHIDMYDLKPDAPVEYRGEFKPIQTNVPGFDICELMPLQAKIADKLALVRTIQFSEATHLPDEVFTGFVGSAREAAVWFVHQSLPGRSQGSARLRQPWEKSLRHRRRGARRVREALLSGGVARAALCRKYG